MRKTIVLLIFIGLSLNGFGQSNKKKRENIRALKTAFITEKLELSSSEAEKFWPIYNAYTRKNKTLKRQLFGNRRATNSEDYSEKQAEEKLNKMLLLEKEIYQNKIQFLLDLKKVISSKKILQLLQAEKSFNRKLLQQLKHP